jgi:hypothetical protein
MQTVGADHEIETAASTAVEGDRTVRGYGGDPVAEDVLHVVAGGVVADLAEVVAHDFDVPVRGGAEHLPEVDLDRSGGTLTGHDQPVRAGHQFLDPGQHPHPLGDLHRGAEQVDRVPAGLAQRRGALDHGDVVAVAAEPVGEDGTRDARARDEDPHPHTFSAPTNRSTSLTGTSRATGRRQRETYSAGPARSRSTARSPSGRRRSGRSPVCRSHASPRRAVPGR